MSLDGAPRQQSMTSDGEPWRLAGASVWAIVCSALTLLLLVGRYAIIDLRFPPLDDQKDYVVRTSIAVMLTALWAISAVVLTFIAPFVDTGNGYVATVGAFGFAVALLLHESAVQSVVIARREVK